ncbi:PREDICTED: probable serine/threonine- [Prunus dulcis]|uniref:PREDICTED: probable serine/threonine n=1 Tax=Prunus dulcis TaxID=3755 RepID=A0A5E4EZC5_PRUDU|nr:PREDICTED: probable serine/threonine- [Prunus dulcis]
MRSSYGAIAKILRRGKTPLYFIRHQLAQTKLACLAEIYACTKLSKLLNTKKTIEPAFGLKLPKIFDNFEDKPVASGSIAQVHRLRATLRFRYPGQHVKPHSSCHKG